MALERIAVRPDGYDKIDADQGAIARRWLIRPREDMALRPGGFGGCDDKVARVQACAVAR